LAKITGFKLIPQGF